MPLLQYRLFHLLYLRDAELAKGAWYSGFAHVPEGEERTATRMGWDVVGEPADVTEARVGAVEEMAYATEETQHVLAGSENTRHKHLPVYHSNGHCGESWGVQWLFR